MSGVGSRGAGRWPGGVWVDHALRVVRQGGGASHVQFQPHRACPPPVLQPPHAPDDASADRKPWEV